MLSPDRTKRQLNKTRALREVSTNHITIMPEQQVKPQADISQEILKSEGWTIHPYPDIPFVLMEKKIENRNPLNQDPDDTEFSLQLIVGLEGQNRFVIHFPNGSDLYFIANNHDELRRIENSLDWFDCGY